MTSTTENTGIESTSVGNTLRPVSPPFFSSYLSNLSDRATKRTNLGHSHEILESDTKRLTGTYCAVLSVQALPLGLAILDEGIHDYRLANALHRDVVTGPLPVLKKLLGRVITGGLRVLPG